MHCHKAVGIVQSNYFEIPLENDDVLLSMADVPFQNYTTMLNSDDEMPSSSNGTNGVSDNLSIFNNPHLDTSVFVPF